MESRLGGLAAACVKGRKERRKESVAGVRGPRGVDGASARVLGAGCGSAGRKASVAVLCGNVGLAFGQWRRKEGPVPCTLGSGWRERQCCPFCGKSMH